MSQELYSRRNLLAATGVGITGLLAGCSNTSNDSNSNREDSSSNKKDSSDYQLNFSLENTVDLTDLPTSDLDNFDEIRSEDYVELEYQLLEDGEEVEPERIQLMLEGEDGEENTVELGPEVDNGYQLACYELLEGENKVTLEAETDGEKIESENTETTEKKTPDAYLIEGKVDGEAVTAYSSPYGFDTHNLDKKKFIQERHKRQEERADLIDEVYEDMDEERFNEVFEDESLSEKERKGHLLYYAGIDVTDKVSRHSSQAERQAAHEEELLIEKNRLY